MDCDGLGYDDRGNCEGSGNECGTGFAGVDEYDDECNYCDGEGTHNVMIVTVMEQ